MEGDPPQGDQISLRASRAEEIFAAIPQATEDIAGRPLAGEAAVDFMKRLHGGPTPEDALTFAAYAFRPRYAVWWAYECLMARPEFLTTDDRDMLAVAVQWVAAQDEPSRNGAMTRALSAERGPGTWVALGAGWSGGSMVSPDHAPVPVQDFFVGRAVSTGVLMFLSRVVQEERRRWLAQFVFMAQSLAASG